MKRAPSSQQPQAVLFVCGLNSVRSPMAAALLRQALGTSLYVGSAGVRKGERDPFAAAVMDEVGIDIKAHRPMTFEELEDLEGLNFDLIVTLSPEAREKLLELRAEEPEGERLGLRLEIVSDPGADFRYDLSFDVVTTAALSDEVRNHDGFRVIIPGNDVDSLQG